MTKQEIFQNMTKGEWFSTDATGNIRVGTENPTSIGTLSASAEIFNARGEISKWKFNAMAASIAVNQWQNLMSKGINPEAVETMYNLLETILPTLMPAQMKQVKEALNTAKL